MHKKIAYGGISTALAVIMLVFSTYLPTAKAATLFAASALVYGFRLICGVRASFAMYAASAILGFLLSSGASPAIAAAFIICFGNYPVLRCLTENRPLSVMIILRAVLYTVYFALAFWVFKYLIPVEFPFSPVILYGAGAVLFAMYDVLLKYTGDYIVQLFYRIKR